MRGKTEKVEHVIEETDQLDTRACRDLDCEGEAAKRAKETSEELIVTMMRVPFARGVNTTWIRVR